MRIIRVHKKKIGRVTMYVQECPTIWIVSTKVDGYSDGNSTKVRYKKKNHCVIDEVAQEVLNNIRMSYKYTNKLGVERIVNCTYKEYLFIKLNYGLEGLTDEEYKLYKTI